MWRGEAKQGGKYERSRRSNWVKDRQREQGKGNLERGSLVGLVRKPGTRETPSKSQG